MAQSALARQRQSAPQQTAAGHEVYGLAKAFGLKPSQLFNYFYGDGERPVVGV